jgi:hypothetical protein
MEKAPVFGGIGDQLMQHYAQSLSGFRKQRYVWSADLSIVCEIRRKFAPDNLFQ